MDSTRIVKSTIFQVRNAPLDEKEKVKTWGTYCALIGTLIYCNWIIYRHSTTSKARYELIILIIVMNR